MGSGPPLHPPHRLGQLEGKQSMFGWERGSVGAQPGRQIHGAGGVWDAFGSSRTGTRPHCCAARLLAGARELAGAARRQGRGGRALAHPAGPAVHSPTQPGQQEVNMGRARASCLPSRNSFRRAIISWPSSMVVRSAPDSVSYLHRGGRVAVVAQSRARAGPGTAAGGGVGPVPALACHGGGPCSSCFLSLCLARPPCRPRAMRACCMPCQAAQPCVTHT